MVGCKNRQMWKDIHIIGVLEEKQNWKKGNATELILSIKHINLLTKKKKKKKQYKGKKQNKKSKKNKKKTFKKKKKKKAQQGTRQHRRTSIIRHNLIPPGVIRKKYSAHSFSLGRKEGWSMCLTFQILGELLKGLTSASLNSEGWLNQHSLDAWGLWRTKKNLRLISTPENFQYQQQTPEGAKDYMILKKKRNKTF